MSKTKPQNKAGSISILIDDLRSYVMLPGQWQEKGMKNSGLDETGTLTLRRQWSAQPFELSGQLGAGHYVGQF